MELTDGNVTLRTPVDDDAVEVAAGVQDSLETLSPWMPWATESYDESAARSWIQGEIEPNSVRCVLIGGDGRMVGSAGLNHFDTANNRANLGYWLRADATGFGYATSATRLLARYGLDELGLHRIEVMMSVENDASRQVAIRAGAGYEGVQRGRLLLRGRYHDAHGYAFVATTADDATITDATITGPTT